MAAFSKISGAKQKGSNILIGNDIVTCFCATTLLVNWFTRSFITPPCLSTISCFRLYTPELSLIKKSFKKSGLYLNVSCSFVNLIGKGALNVSDLLNIVEVINVFLSKLSW